METITIYNPFTFIALQFSVCFSVCIISPGIHPITGDIIQPITGIVNPTQSTGTETTSTYTSTIITITNTCRITIITTRMISTPNMVEMIMDQNILKDRSRTGTTALKTDWNSIKTGDQDSQI